LKAGPIWDAVVVGGGLIGSSIAYHLAAAGVRTLLVERGDLASGASGANFGLVQVQDTEFDLSLELTLLAYGRFATLERKLDYDLGYRRGGYLLLIESDHQWATLEQRAATLRAAGLQVELLDAQEVCRMEPYLAPESVIGGLYHPDEGELDPFKLVHAFALRGRDQGLELWTHTAVSRVQLRSGRAVGVETSRGDVQAGWVVLAAGAWTRPLGQTAGVDLLVRWVHGEALITEPLAPVAHRAMTSAAFFEETVNSDEQTVGFCIHQRPEGNVMIGEAAFLTDRLSRQVSSTALPVIAREAQRRFPVLRQAAVIRAWAIPVACTPDNRPLLGPVDEVGGLLVATGLKSTIILTPLVGELVAAMVTGGEVDLRLAEFSPSRALSKAR
jgi:sarcosine oxidase, subunit beta